MPKDRKRSFTSKDSVCSKIRVIEVGEKEGRQQNNRKVTI